MILIVCDDDDLSAAWAADMLSARGLAPTLLTGRDLADVTHWRHSVAADGRASLELRLGDGRTLRSDDVSGVLNRLTSVPWSWLSRLGGPDVRYAAQELHALFLSWLQGLPGPMLNRPTPQGLCGNNRHPSAWVALAARAGLPVAPYRQTSADDPAELWSSPYPAASRSVVAIAGRAIGDADLIAAWGEACVRLSAMSGCALLGVDFAEIDRGWRFAAATPSPYLASGGPALADALAEALCPAPERAPMAAAG
ncbi:MAG TPA: hypothetical protein VMT68_18950 [Caulobacteraceae bacterium]|nr:hypothetical protein [Caulobacteraceae bacterium]